MLGIIGGTSLLFAELPDLKKTEIATPYGSAELYLGDIALLLRHQYGMPPHRINFPACISALAIAGVDRVVAFGSVGSLKKSIGPNSIIIPDDYATTTAVPTIHNHSQVHVMPGIDTDLSAEVSACIPESQNGGTYVQAGGPRIETKAEVSALSRIGDVVGMTVSSEATLCNELGIAFSAICMVDNYAHGLGEDELSYEQILNFARANTKKTEMILERIITRIG
ncbi:MTAP family purine nucleoside phosphorylase [Methanogenium sp. MK-MG]|uniref:MTAP family purine nucleoside phosphorylase n=1 Tax=Methanogenium sp. MK-MG TaxID=2599926 RepID=UPI0013EDE21C|nr:MTAP family purine nucleoside phosphorylase [Methanogenium sp. MK-MG]KAF1074673.1 putative 6-oxopurine nucleoside phosphorylase [Methanogenium sp. MK-MG]